MEEDKIHYYGKTVSYVVGGRRYPNDPLGFVITPQTPFVEIRDSGMRAFKLANQRALEEGLLIEIDEPSVEWGTKNVYTDEQIDEVLKKGVKEVRRVAPEITSVSVISRILERAKAQRRSEVLIDVLEERLEELDTEEVTMEHVERAYNA